MSLTANAMDGDRIFRVIREVRGTVLTEAICNVESCKLPKDNAALG